MIKNTYKKKFKINTMRKFYFINIFFRKEFFFCSLSVLSETYRKRKFEQSVWYILQCARRTNDEPDFSGFKNRNKILILD